MTDQQQDPLAPTSVASLFRSYLTSLEALLLDLPHIIKEIEDETGSIPPLERLKNHLERVLRYNHPSY